MAQFINFSELYNSGGSFAKQEVTVNGSTTTVYGGYAPRSATGAETAAMPGWIIRRLVVVENGTTQNIECTWARGSWDDRATLDYQYQLPATPDMYAEQPLP